MSGRVLVLAASAACLGLLAAGCGGASTTPSVASLSQATTASAASTGPKQTPSFPAFAACMTAHGVPTSTGPDGRGIMIQGGNPGSPRFQSASAACEPLLPGGGPPQLTPAQEAERAKGLAAFAACMRTHGVPGFPDPNGSGDFPFAALSRIDSGSPIFRRAYVACRPLFPKLGPQIRLGP